MYCNCNLKTQITHNTYKHFKMYYVHESADSINDRLVTKNMTFAYKHQVNQDGENS